MTPIKPKPEAFLKIKIIQMMNINQKKQKYFFPKKIKKDNPDHVLNQVLSITQNLPPILINQGPGLK
jgi:hypothetical protein